jgi:hypothetical protein
MKFLSAMLLVLLMGCPITTCDTPSSPEPPVVDTPPPPPERPPRVDQPFSWDAYQGIIAFGLGHPGQTEADVLAFVQAAMAQGWNTFQICSECEFWDNSFAYPQKPRDPERLRWTLDIIARVPGAQVALIGNCTLKRQIPLDQQIKGFRAGGVSAAEAERWSRTVANIARDFQNVAIFTHNEFDNCRGRGDWGGDPSYCAGKQDVAEHIRIYRDAGIKYVTADDSFRPPVKGDPPQLTYGFRLANIGAWPASFHPDREKDRRPWDPSPHQLRELARYNGLYVLSETVAWTDFSGRCDGLRTCDPVRLDTFIGNCAAVPECRFTFHCEHCLNGLVPTHIPRAQ